MIIIVVAVANRLLSVMASSEKFCVNYLIRTALLLMAVVLVAISDGAALDAEGGHRVSSGGHRVSSSYSFQSNESCPLKPEEEGLGFLNFGHSGGDPLAHCENTLEAGLAGLAQGMNAVEVDVCMSRDGVLFLWHDCNMYDSLSMLRRLGRFLPNDNCLPYHHPLTYGKNPRELTFATIQSHYGYKQNYDKNNRLNYRVPKLRTFLRRIGTTSQIKRIYIDVKETERGRVGQLLTTLISLAREKNVEHKLLVTFLSRDLVVYANSLEVVRQSKVKMVMEVAVTVQEVVGSHHLHSLKHAIAILEEALSDSYSVGYWDKLKIGYYLSKGLASFTGGVLANLPSLYKKMADREKIILQVKKQCMSYVAVGISPLPDIISHYLYKKSLRAAVNERRTLAYPAKIIAWTINDGDLLQWIASNDVNGVITDKPGPMHQILKNQ